MDENENTPTFRSELQVLINRYSVENLSDTPDYILASFVENVLTDFAHAVNARTRHMGG